LIKNKDVLSFVSSDFHFYNIFQFAKQNRLSLSNPNHFSLNLFDLLHDDV